MKRLLVWVEGKGCGRGLIGAREGKNQHCLVVFLPFFGLQGGIVEGTNAAAPFRPETKWRQKKFNQFARDMIILCFYLFIVYAFYYFIQSLLLLSLLFKKGFQRNVSPDECP